MNFDPRIYLFNHLIQFGGHSEKDCNAIISFIDETVGLEAIEFGSCQIVKKKYGDYLQIKTNTEKAKDGAMYIKTINIGSHTYADVEAFFAISRSSRINYSFFANSRQSATTLKMAIEVNWPDKPVGLYVISFDSSRISTVKFYDAETLDVLHSVEEGTKALLDARYGIEHTGFSPEWEATISKERFLKLCQASKKASTDLVDFASKLSFGDFERLISEIKPKETAPVFEKE